MVPTTHFAFPEVLFIHRGVMVVFVQLACVVQAPSRPESEGTSPWDSRFHVGSPLDTLLSIVNHGTSVTDEGGPRYLHHIVYIDASAFLPAARDRVYILLVHKDITNRESVMGNIVEIFEQRWAERHQPLSSRVKDFYLPPDSKLLAQRLAEKQAWLGPLNSLGAVSFKQ